MAASMRNVSLLSRFRGSLVGAVVGDCIGAKFEDKLLPCVPWDEIAEHLKFLETVSDDLESFTDDTAMVRSVARSLIEHEAFHAQDMAEKFVTEFYKEPDRGYGGNVVKVFEKLKKSDDSDVFKPAREQFDGMGSYGNGGAMRIAPVALFALKFKDFSVLRDLSENITRLTHANRNGILGAVLQAFAVDLALCHPADADLDQTKYIESLIERIRPLEVLEPGEDDDGPSRPKRRSEDVPQPYTNKLIMMKDYFKDNVPNIEDIIETLGNDISALGSVPTAIYSFLRATNSIESIPVDGQFERAVLYAISMGGDTDTIASMAGAIAGAYYGVEAIPDLWQKCCEGVSDAIQQADDLYKIYEKGSCVNKESKKDKFSTSKKATKTDILLTLK